jgi:histidinol phosphatase-like enzyme (inositol monophosphatase family)
MTPQYLSANDLNLLAELADAAGAAILPHFRTGMAIDNKRPDGAFDPVTIADRAAEQAMRAVITRKCPGDAILGEEFGQTEGAVGSQRQWILDPIDGTRGFICGLPTWGVLAGLMQGGKPKLGMMHQPYVGESFIGDGKSSLHLRAGKSGTLRTSSCKTLADARLATTSPFLFPDIAIGRYRAVEARCRMARYGTDCYAYALLAAGSIDLVIEHGLKAYDIMPLIPIIEGAGGVVTTWTGTSAAQGGAIVAAATRALHREVVEILST